MMITYEDCQTAHDYAEANLARAKEAESRIIRKPVPIYSEMTPGLIIGHRLVKMKILPKTESIIESKDNPINLKNEINMKRCTKCGKEKPLADFNKMAKAKDGLQSWCKSCKDPSIKSATQPIESNKHVEIPVPCAKLDQGKLRYDLCPAEWAETLAEVMTGGLVKYDADSWRFGEPRQYEAALMRHLIAWRKGEIEDNESGLNHLKHVMANAAILLSITCK